MNRHFNEESLRLVRELVKNITQFEDDTEIFRFCEKYAVTNLENADSMVFLNKKQIDAIMISLSEKFAFHGFIVQSSDFLKLYKRYIPEILPKADLNTRLNAIKFLTVLSERPTAHLAKDPFGYKRKEEVEEIVDWPAYLNEGIERWSPTHDDDDDSEDFSDEDYFQSTFDKNGEKNAKTGDQMHLRQLKIEFTEQYEDYSNAKEYLKQNVQNTWFNLESVCMVPESTNIEANYGIKWEDHLQEKTYGMIPRCNILKEYVAVREVLWQCFAPTSACFFELKGNRLIAKQDVTISSVRRPTFETLLEWFLPHFELLQSFRDFYDTVWSFRDESKQSAIPDTYRNYAVAYQRNIIEPVYRKLIDVEREVVKQESITTLLWLSEKLNAMFKPANVLKEIHANVVLNFNENCALMCSIHLLTKLHVGLVHSTSKLEQDLCLTLYLESLYKYLSMIDAWLRNGKWSDQRKEFVITEESNEVDWNLQFGVRDLDFSKTNTLIKIICSDVLEIGKNVHLLLSLKKYHLVESASESLHEELKRRFLQEIRAYFQVERDSKTESGVVSDEALVAHEVVAGYQYKFPATCPDYCKYPTEFDRLENLVDTTDGFLMVAFERYFSVPKNEEAVQEETLYATISSITKTLFPAHEILVKVFSAILQEKYGQYGLRVKNLLSTEYKLKEHLELLRHIFLFKDDVIFPLYRRIFKLLNSNLNWGNDIWLTSHIQDIIIDYHPDFFEKCTISVRDYWKECSDPIKACNMISMQYRIDWPISIIIESAQLEKYQEVFQFVLKIKWALYTLHHLYFSELTPKKEKKARRVTYKNIPQRLRMLRFFLINQFTTVQHFILGYMCNKFGADFERKFEKANSLDGMISAHADYIDHVHKCCAEIRDYNIILYGLNSLLYSVWDLRKMWLNVTQVDDKELQECEKACKMSHRNLEPIMCRKKIYVDYSSDES